MPPNPLIAHLERLLANVQHNEELHREASKLFEMVTHTVNQVANQTHIPPPPEVGSNIEAHIEDYSLVDEAEQWVEQVRPILTNVVEATAVRSGKGPLHELLYWKDRNSALSSVYDQLNSIHVRNVVNLLSHPKVNKSMNLPHLISQIKSNYTEANQNVKFLGTLERHFKNLARGNLSLISDTIPSMFSALRIVWVTSKHYRDERMSNLLERIGYEIAQRVSAAVDVRSIFDMPPRQAMDKLQQAHDVLEKWRAYYFQTRQTIENAQDDRWEFHHQKDLFDRTHYMADRCMDLHSIEQKFAEFNDLLGPTMKAITSSAGIEQLRTQIEALKIPLKDMTFDLFEKRSKNAWTQVKTSFDESVKEIMATAKEFINTSFRQLRSTEEALGLLLKFRTMKTNEIQREMASQSTEVVQQYLRDLAATEQEFDAKKADPPRFKNQPPIAGSIAWADSLLHRVRPAMRILYTLHEKQALQLGSSPDSPDYMAVQQRFIRLGTLLREYKKQRHKDYTSSVSMTHLNDSILALDAHKRIVVNFNPELVRLIRETRYINRLGLSIPGMALDIALQEDKYHEYRTLLEDLVQSYYQSLEMLRPGEAELMANQAAVLRVQLEQGISMHNWNALGIAAFVSNCTGAISRFQSQVGQIHEFADRIQSIVEAIAQANLVRLPDALAQQAAAGHLLDIQSYLDGLEQHRAQVVASLAEQYRVMGLMLSKIEEVVENDNSRANPRMRTYYHHWELQIHQAIQQMLDTNLAAFRRLMSPPPSASASQGPGPSASGSHNAAKAKAPLFVVETQLLPPFSIECMPKRKEITRMVNSFLKNILSSPKQFPRWRKGTCIECPIQEKDNGFQYTFFQWEEDRMEAAEKATLLDRSLDRISGFFETWKGNERLKKIFNRNKDSYLKRLFGDTSKKFTCTFFDGQLSSYTQLLRDVQELPDSRDIDSIRISLAPLKESFTTDIRSWIESIGEYLHTGSRPALEDMMRKMERLSEELHRDPEASLDDLKFVLNVIARIRSMDMETELEYLDIMERYRMMRHYRVDVSAEELNTALTLDQKWRALVQEAGRIDAQLESVKEKFKSVTQQDVETFKTAVSDLNVEFRRVMAQHTAEGASMDDGAKMIREYQRTLAEKNEEREQYLLAEKLFNLPLTSYKDLQEMETQLTGLAKIYDLYLDVKSKIDEWSSGLWADLKLSVLDEGMEQFTRRIKRLPKELHQLRPYRQVTEMITSFSESIPLINDLKSDALRVRHWQDLMEATGQSFDINTQTFTLKNLFDMQLHNHAARISDITTGAMRELKIENELNEIIDAWKSMKFGVARHSHKGVDRGFILRSVDPILEMLDDHTQRTQGFQSRYARPHAQLISQWEAKLGTISEVVQLWVDVQKKWIYLENIFIGSEDICYQLPEQAEVFKGIDKDFLKINADTSKNLNVDEACHVAGRQAKLQNLMRLLEDCQRGLTNYLETKRQAFPRFYFISEDDILSILGSSDPEEGVKRHLGNLFENCSKLKFGTGTKARTIYGMVSEEGEAYDFRTPVQAEGSVEQWMTAVETEMRRTLRQITKEALFYYPQMDRTRWIEQQLGMATVVGSQVWWTWEIEDVFRSVRRGNKYAMKELSARLHTQIGQLVAMMRGQMSNLFRRKVRTLIILDVHGRDIVDRFVRDSILDAREFDWESQVRFYFDKPSDQIIMRQCTGSFEYGYEYIGLRDRLVITPLTDRCYMTLTQALSMRFGGSPAGPAGTGKTETVKDLAKAMAILCIVFNCQQGINYLFMASFFTGLCECGAWGCFDEFNRIAPEVLSVVSSQIKTIQTALSAQARSFRMESSREVKLDPKIGIFVTMNPGYAGRSELPDNLKALFRPVVMVKPDNEQICEIMLFSEGFDGAKQLAKKMTVLYKLAEGQLSKQMHYDFGLRALKSVLVMAGNLKRTNPDTSEDVVLMRALRDSNLPKFVFEDVPLFLGLVKDLFPGLDPPKQRYPELNQAVEDVLREMGYVIVEDQCDKVVQLYDTMCTRHTTMVVGPTGGGKSVIIRALQEAQKKLNYPTKIHMLNPKAVTIDELYGIEDPTTREWTDGLLSKIFRDINTTPAEKRERRYILFDGDVDAHWVENMNSVMDDNRLLTLPNRDRIYLKPNCALLFEVADLSYASPATVSRCGMVFVDPQNLGYSPFFEMWVSNRRAEEAEILRSLFNKYIPSCIEYILEGLVDGIPTEDKLRCIIPTTNLNMARQFCKLFESITDESAPQLDRAVIECLFIFCLMWSLGALLVGEARTKFDAFVKRRADFKVIDIPDMSAGVNQLPGQLPTLYEYFFDVETRKWRPWSDRVTDYQPPADGRFCNILVPTVDTVRNKWILDRLVTNDHPVLFIGESGTAKTVTIMNYIASSDPETTSRLTVNFSNRTTSMHVQRTLEDNLDNRGGGRIFKPRQNKKLIIFIDDLNMPQVDPENTQQPIALLKMLFDRGGVYSRDDLQFYKFNNLRWICAMAPPGGGRYPVDPRFTSKFCMFNIPFPSQTTLRHIYNTILEDHLDPFPERIRKVTPTLTNMTLDLYDHIYNILPPTPSKFHYIFNLRDLSRIYEGLTFATLDKFQTVESIVRLWRNECLRTFHDRLINDADKTVVKDKIAELVETHFAEQQEAILVEPTLFSSFRTANQENEVGTRLYEDLETYDVIKPIIEDCLELYNEEKRRMNLVMFEDALEHLTRIHRVITMCRGNALLVGFGGSGKQSLTRLATYVAGYQLFEITLSRGYGEVEFREDLKRLYHMLGIEDKQCTFLFTDAHVVHTSFLEYINSMLTTGMVSALYTEQEKDEVINQIRDEVTKLGLFDTADCWAYFVSKCRNNLHIVLAMSPAGETLRKRCRDFPGLVSNTVIDWFHPWSQQALYSVANAFLADEDLPDRSREEIISHMVKTHQSIARFSHDFLLQLRRRNYSTPKNYLDYIGNYRKLLSDNRRRLKELQTHLTVGLQRLTQASDEVDIMNENLTKQKAITDAKAKEVDALVVKIQLRAEEAEKKAALASAKEADVSDQQEKIQAAKNEAERLLEQAQPALIAAKDALSFLSNNKDKIAETRAYAKPPQQVVRVGECLVILLGSSGTELGWGSAKSIMARADFVESLLRFNLETLTDKKINRIQRNYLDKGGFTPEEVESHSAAAAVMLRWVVGIVQYYNQAKSVFPLQRDLERLIRESEASQRELDAIKAEIERISKERAELSAELERQRAEQQVLKNELENMERQLSAATRLISGLGTEKVRWAKELEEIADRMERLVGDCLLTAAFLSYTGAFTHDFRTEMVYTTWLADIRERGIPLSDDFSLETLLTDEVEKAQWASESLPSDELSIQNGILTTRSSRFPLCIDPQMQAVKWIRRREGKNGLIRASMNDPNVFVPLLERAIFFGQPFLFENVDEYIDPILDPILEKNIIKHPTSSRRFIYFNEKEVDWHPNFRLYMTTRLSNPEYSPEITGKTMIINYSVTPKGLEDQLLNVVVRLVREDLETRHEELIRTMSDLRHELKDLEQRLLHELLNCKGTMLDDENLIQVLETTKSTAIEVGEKLERAADTKQLIDEARQKFSPVAERGSILFFVMSSLSAVSTMYQYSLDAFLQLFTQALQQAPGNDDFQTRLENFIVEVTDTVFNYTCLGLFDRHRLMFAFSMVLNILKTAGRIDVTELDFFLKGSLSLEKSSREKPYPWVLDQGWEDLIRLITMGAPFDTLADDLEAHEDEWKAWYDLEKPEVAPFPMGYSEKTNDFQRLCILRCFRQDRIFHAVQNFIVTSMDEKYVTFPFLKYPEIYKRSTHMAPLVFIISPGANPAEDIINLGESLGFTVPSRLRAISLGQGQSGNAEKALEQGAQRGYWVLLQNCHLLADWLRTLEKILEKLYEGETKPHEDFRLFLTTEPTDAFPLAILQRSLKIVTEPPNSLKMNMLQTYARLTEEDLQACEHYAFRPLVYVLSFFHAVVQERRKYGKLGWNVPYDFNESDFKVSFDLLATYLNKTLDCGADAQIPWGSLRYLIGEAMYGGRVTDNFDRRILITYLDEYMGDFLFDRFQPFFFYKDESVAYSVPDVYDYDEYVERIRTDIPRISPPEVFGLHSNAEISYSTDRVRALWKNLIELQPRAGSSVGPQSRDMYITQVATDIEQKLPEPFNVSSLRKEIGTPSPTEVVLLQELDRWNYLVHRMGLSLRDLKRALLGEIGMSNELDELADSLSSGFLPSIWRRLCPSTEKNLANWIEHFEARYRQYRSWVDDGEPAVIWLSGLHIPEAYLTALVQAACRKFRWPLDKSTLYTKVTQYENAAEVSGKLDVGCYVRGLYLEGAAWDKQRRCLVRQNPKELTIELPIMQVIPIEVSQKKLQNMFVTPVYVTQQRADKMGVGLVFEADLDTSYHPSHWILQGVALSLNVT